MGVLFPRSALFLRPAVEFSDRLVYHRVGSGTGGGFGRWVRSGAKGRRGTRPAAHRVRHRFVDPLGLRAFAQPQVSPGAEVDARAVRGDGAPVLRRRRTRRAEVANSPSAAACSTSPPAFLPNPCTSPVSVCRVTSSAHRFGQGRFAQHFRSAPRRPDLPLSPRALRPPPRLSNLAATSAPVPTGRRSSSVPRAARAMKQHRWLGTAAGAGPRAAAASRLHHSEPMAARIPGPSSPSADLRKGQPLAPQAAGRPATLVVVAGATIRCQGTPRESMPTGATRHLRDQLRAWPAWAALLATALILGLAAHPAGAERSQRGHLIVAVNGGVLPLELPRDRAAPVALRIGGRISTDDGSSLPRMTRIRLAIAGRGVLATAGLPVCRERGCETRQRRRPCAAATAPSLAAAVWRPKPSSPARSRFRSRPTCLPSTAAPPPAARPCGSTPSPPAHRSQSSSPSSSLATAGGSAPSLVPGCRPPSATCPTSAASPCGSSAATATRAKAAPT